MKPRCRVKICGITSKTDAMQVAALGADAIGLVFYAKSPRHVGLAQAAEISQHLPPFINSVGLFFNAEAEFVYTVLAQVPLQTLQFHGAETPAYCEQFGLPYLKAIGMKGIAEYGGLDAYTALYNKAQGFLVDSHAPGEAGGTGQSFDWIQVPHAFPRPLILAGGLRPENVAQAINTTHVYAVDVSSGVEKKPGVKDMGKVRAFMQAVAQTSL